MFDTTNTKSSRLSFGRRSRAAALAVALLGSTTYSAYAVVIPPGIDITPFLPLIYKMLDMPPAEIVSTISGLGPMVAADIWPSLSGPLNALLAADPTAITSVIKAAIPLLVDPAHLDKGKLNDLINAILPDAKVGGPLYDLVQPGGFLDHELKDPKFSQYLLPGGIGEQLLGKDGPLAYLLEPGNVLAGLAGPGGSLAAFAPAPVTAAPTAPPPPPDTTAPAVNPAPTDAPIAPIAPTAPVNTTVPGDNSPPPVVAPTVVAPANTPMANAYGPGTTVDAADITAGPFSMDDATLVFSTPSTLSNTITSAAGGLTVDTEANGVLAGVITGPGGLTKIGNAELTLSAINSYNGDTDVKAGLLNNDGTLVNSTIIVENNATLGGTGTAFGVHAKPGGTIAPGHSIGTLHIGTGGLQMDKGSIYHVEIDADGHSDKIVTQGAALIGGAKLMVTAEFGNAALQLADLENIDQTYDILDAANGVSGKFDISSMPHYAFFDIGVDYSNVTSVMLTVGRNGLTFADVGKTPNQRAMGYGVEGLGSDNPLYDMMLSSPTIEDARTLEQQLSGEIHGDVLGEVLDDSAMIRNAVIDRLNNRDPEGSAFWLKAIDSFGSTGSDGNAAKVKRQTDGLSAGVDTSLGGSWLAGVAGNYEATPLQTKGAGSASIQSYHFALYTGGDVYGLSLHLGAAYGHYTAKTTRLVPLLSLVETGRENADQTQMFGELGYPIVNGDTTIEPFLDLSYTDAHLASFAETEDLGALNARGQSIDRMQSILGGRYSLAFRDNDTVFSPNITLGWMHNFSGITPGVRMGFVDGPADDTFTVDGVSTNADAAFIRAGLDAAIGSGFNLGVGYEGQIGERTQDHAVRLSIRMNY